MGDVTSVCVQHMATKESQMFKETENCFIFALLT